MYYEIDETTARRAKEMCSFSDYKPGSATSEYRQMVDDAAALVEAKKKTVSPFYHAKLDGYLESYSRRLAKWQNDYNRNGASCPSILVCGPANFPVRKKEKQNAREDSLWSEYAEIKSLLDKIKSIGTGPVDFADPHAREMLADKADRLQAALDRYKAMNAHYRKNKTMQGFPGLDDTAAAEMDKRIKSDYTWAQKPAPDYELQSLRGKIKRAQERIAEYKAKAEKYAKNIAKTIINAGGGGDFGQNAFFYESAEGIITAIVLLLAELCPPETRHIVSVFKLLQDLVAPSDVPGQTKFKQLMEQLPEEHKARWFSGAALNTSEQAMASVLSTAMARLNVFLDSEMEQILCFDTQIDAEKFCAEKTAVFIILPEEDVSKYFMASLIVQQMYREILTVADETGGKLKNRVMFFLDEIGTLPKIESLEIMFSAIRSRRVTIQR